MGCCTSHLQKPRLGITDSADSPFYIGSASGFLIDPGQHLVVREAVVTNLPPWQSGAESPFHGTQLFHTSTYSGRLASARPHMTPQLPPGVFLPPLDFSRLPHNQRTKRRHTSQINTNPVPAPLPSPQVASGSQRPPAAIPPPRLGQVFVVAVQPDGFGYEIGG
jgi:hypothetical protein